MCSLINVAENENQFLENLIFINCPSWGREIDWAAAAAACYHCDVIVHRVFLRGHHHLPGERAGEQAESQTTWKLLCSIRIVCQFGDHNKRRTVVFAFSNDDFWSNIDLWSFWLDVNAPQGDLIWGEKSRRTTIGLMRIDSWKKSNSQNQKMILLLCFFVQIWADW